MKRIFKYALCTLLSALCFPVSAQNTTWQPLIEISDVVLDEDLLSVSLTNLSEEIPEATVIAGLYSGSDLLTILSCQMNDFSGEENIQYDVNNITFDNIRLFIWDNYSEIEPLGVVGDYTREEVSVMGSIDHDNTDFTNHGYVTELGYTTFAECINLGYYAFNTNHISDITDAPTELKTAGTLFVFPDSGGKNYNRVILDISGNMWSKYASRDWVQNINTEAAKEPVLDNARWCAMGDSITEGYYSYLDEDGAVAYAKSPSESWAYKVADINGYELTNAAIGGTGYLATGPNKRTNAKELADTINFADYDLVTLAYGVNDWKYNQTLGTMNDDIENGNTVIANMRYVIEKISSDNPYCKIIVITPINCSYFGDYDSNYGIGYKFSKNGTLDEVCDAFIDVCEYYGIEYIDMTHKSFINRKNITSVLIDGVHPSVQGHDFMARELSKKITMY